MLKSTQRFKPEIDSKIGAQTSSVTPGYTVDSMITKSPCLRTKPTIRIPSVNGSRFGVLS